MGRELRVSDFECRVVIDSMTGEIVQAR